MTTQNLKEYLGIILDLESNVYFQQKLINDLQSRIRALKVQKESLTPPKKPKPPEKPEISYISVWTSLSIAAVGVAILLFAHYLSNNHHGFFAFIVGFFGFIFVFSGVICGIVYGIEDHNENEQQKYAYSLSTKAYPSQLNNYNTMMESYQSESVSLPQKIQYCNMLLEAIQRTQSRTNSILMQFYDYNIIYPKWRGFVNVSNLYDYIASGMCTSLEGPHGAYEQLMEDMRADRIITSIEAAKNQILHAMNSIYLNQCAIINELQGIDNKMNAISNNINLKFELIDKATQDNTNLIEKIKSDSSVLIYQNERMQKELQYANRMNYLIGK